VRCANYFDISETLSREEENMGREIRMVPKDWEHPQDQDGEYISMLDETFDDAAKEWLANCIAWANGTHEDFATEGGEHSYYWLWESDPPRPESYRPAFTSPADHFQIYQNVSEGTPVSPVFASREELADWLVGQGRSRAAADAFAKSGYAPSMLFVNGRLLQGIDACEAS
jgi:hypothetical protein